MHDEQVMQIVIAAGETTEKVCMVTPWQLRTELLPAWVT